MIVFLDRLRRGARVTCLVGIIFSKFVYIENIDRDVILLRQNVVTSSGRAVIRPTRLDL